MPTSRVSRPRLALPDPLRGTDAGSFAEYTVAVRMPAIGRRVFEENTLDEASARRMEALLEELPNGVVEPLDDPFAPDVDAWNEQHRAVAGQTWLQVPWFFAETYFYRRIVAAVRYFAGDGRVGLDPFAYQKRRGLEVSDALIRRAFEELEAALSQGWSTAAFAALIKADLWGNQADLSLWPADDQNHPTHAADEADAHLLVDDAMRAAEHFERRPGGRLDVLVDNAGFELVGDLVLADYVLSTSAASKVVLHVKLHPTFVSDAMEADVRATIDFLAESSHESVRHGGERLRRHLESGALVLRTHPFWTSPLPAWEMPEDVCDDLAASDLVVSKGDANYRRLLGDLKWPLDTPFRDIVNYFPAPVVVLRTYKSELGCGVDSERIARLKQEDPEWMTNGRWGIVQMEG
ncbi:MAG TPA: damage-control phosphatase ARMT1 family protein [Rhodothermales bacterium]